MKLWGRVGPKLLEFSRHGTGIGRISWKHSLFVERRSIFCGRRPHCVVGRLRSEQFVPLRHLAAPVQATKPKPEATDTQGPRLNNAITSPFVRLVSDEGHAIVSRHQALDRAMKLKLDLVEVQRNAHPPVCKIMDYHKEKYKQQAKEKDRMKSKSELLRKGDFKEVRFTMKTEQKDLQIKANAIIRLMERGYRVKCMAMGNEDQDLGALLSRLAVLIEDVSFVESSPRVEKRQAFMVVRHAKFGPSKSKCVPKAAKVMKASASESPSPMTDGISSPCPDIEVQSESEPELESENFSLADDDAEELSADTEAASSDIDDRVPRSDFSLQHDSETPFDFQTVGAKTDSCVEEKAASIQYADPFDTNMLSNDIEKDSATGAVDGNMVDVGSFNSSKAQNNDPRKLFTGADTYRARVNDNKLLANEGTGEMPLSSLSDPALESLRSVIKESREAKDFMGTKPTFSRMSLHPETRSLNGNLLNRENDFNRRSPQVKPAVEFNGNLGSTDLQHHMPTSRRPMQSVPNMTRPTEASNSAAPRREGGRSDPPDAKQGEPLRHNMPTFRRPLQAVLNMTRPTEASNSAAPRRECGRSDPPDAKQGESLRHNMPTFRRPGQAVPNMTRSTEASNSAAPRRESGRSDPPDAKQGEALGSSAPKAGYGIFSASTRQAFVEGSSSRPDSNGTNSNRYKSRSEAQLSLQGNPVKAAREWGTFSRDPTRQKRKNADN